MSKVCPGCHEDYRNSFDVRIYRATNCGHPICTRCLAKSGGKLNLTAASVKCPICGQLSGKLEDTLDEDATFEREAGIRSRVLSILNCDRSTFMSTPLYDKFLEDREDIIYDLAFETDEAVKKNRADYLRHYEMENQQKILEASERLRQRDTDLIRSIVETEGTFYELVRQNFGKKFLKFDAKLIHPLQKHHSHLFKEEEMVIDVGSGLKTANAPGTQSILTQLYLNPPKTLQPNIIYMKLKRNQVDYYLSLEAGGHKKEIVGKRMRQESFVYVRF